MSKNEQPSAEKPSQDPKNPNKKPQWRAPLMVWVLLVVFIFSLVALFKSGAEGISLTHEEAALSQLEFWQRVEQGVVKNDAGEVKGNAALAEVMLVREGQDETSLQGVWQPTPAADGTVSQAKGKPFKLNVLDVTNVENRLAAYGVRTIQQNKSNWFGTVFISVLPILIFFALFYVFFMRRMKGEGEGPFAFGKSRARMMNKEDAKIRFTDVAGVDEAKEEVQEIVDFLKSPKRFEEIGGKVPKGVLLMGPPGTGKTLLAKAIAGEANVPFFTISGSDFVEMFVGVGASRVRDMFA